ncbi:hypothetical protein [Novosphingobium album (ex Liu et al. 2023)]|uniref:Uncharacterized protein n=1 Tax=Novosphingobium album (ex Liu et al. 2023) TaxID=3031130 RepID=A0ABT5WQB2_9SPHN|nr:hypothetical protein [Novosphingobium album (ex Liu et al. 2023)]MDE8651956.1 hypothetical protein [Novosphingobium album (ex Liu et al. 2023)]
MATALSLLVLTTIALVLGGIYLLRRGGARRQALLMFALAAVMAINVAIWTLPDSGGKSLISATGR